MDKVISAFKNVVKNSSPIGGTILNPVGSTVNVHSIWSQRNVERKANVHSLMIQMVNFDEKDCATLTCVDISTELLTSYSPSNLYRGLFRDIPASGKTPKKQHLEIWKKNKLWKVFDLSTYEVHGDVCTDSEFGCFQWSPCETKVLYVAEKKQTKCEPFLGPPAKHSDSKTTNEEDQPKKGGEYELMEDWGESLVGKSCPVLVVADLEADSITQLTGDLPPDLSLGQGVWAPGGGVVGVAWATQPRRLGLVYCTNRQSWLFHLSQDGQFRKLSSDGRSVRSPRFSPDGSRLIWLERGVGGPHHGCQQLVSCEWPSAQSSVVVDIVEEETKTTNGSPFYGLYSTGLTSRCWLSDNKTVVVSTPQRLSVKTYLIDTDSREITEMCWGSGSSEEELESVTVLDVNKDLVLCARSSLDTAPSLVAAPASRTPDWTVLLEQEPLTSGVRVGLLRLEARHPPSSQDVCNFSALYMIPKDVTNAPLVVWSHGGPHSCFTNSTNIVAAFFASLGFGMVMTNYRGSLGSGERCVNFLPGRVGQTDVEDSHQAAMTLLDMFPDQLSRDKCLLFGGSHGGFLSLHLSSQYPSIYKSCTALNPVADLASMYAASDIPDWAVVVRNPVTDIPSIFHLSDIPDWAAVEGGFTYSPTGLLSSDMLDKMKSASPLSRIDSVTAPTLLLLGKKDLRVPSFQGMAYYYQLKARGIKTKVLLYDDSHGLTQVPHEVDFIINTALWFLDAIDHTIE